MSNCLIKRTGQGKIESVLTPQGQKSELFDAIHSNPFMGDVETSVNIFKSAYSKEVEDMFVDAKENVYETKEPKLFYKSSTNRVFDDLEELLITDGGGDIIMGFVDPRNSAFVNVASFNTSETKETKFIEQMITDGQLQAKRSEKDGIVTFFGKGEYTQSHKMGAHASKFDANYDLGVSSSLDGKGGIVFHFDTTDTVEVKTVDGDYYVNTDLAGDYIAISKEKTNLVIQDIFNQRYGAEATKGKDAGLVTNLNFFLEGLGFSKTTLADYSTRFKNVHGADPDVKALADIANSVVAFGEGQETVENLSEEVAHIAIETYSNQADVMQAMVEVEFTPEYQEHAEYYRQKYSQFHTGLRLEEMVRKEILGKVLHKEIINKFNTQERPVKGFLRTIWDNFINFFKSNTSAYHTTTLNELNSRIANSIINAEISEFENQDISKGIFYNASSTEGKNIIKNLREFSQTLKQLYDKTIDKSIPGSAKIEKITDQMSTADSVSMAAAFVGTINNDVNRLTITVNGLKTGENVTYQDYQLYQTIDTDLKGSLAKIVAELQVDPVVQGTPLLRAEVGSIQRMFDETVTNLTRISPTMSLEDTKIIRQEFDNIVKNRQLTPQQTEEAWNEFISVQKDLSLVSKLFGTNTQSRFPILKLLARKISDAYSKARANYINKANPIINKIDQEGLLKHQETLIERNGEGKKTGYLFHMVDRARQEADRLVTQKELIVDIADASFHGKINASETLNEALNYLTPQQVETFSKNYNRIRGKFDMTRMSDEYYKEKEQKIKDLKIGEEAQSTLSEVSIERSKIMAKVMVDGKPDKTLLTPEDKQTLEELNLSIKKSKSPYNGEGSLYDGLDLVPMNEISTEEREAYEAELGKSLEGYQGDIIVRLVPLDQLDKDAREVYDLNKWGMYGSIDMKGGEVDQSFIDKLGSLSSPSEKMAWATSNGHIGFTDEYYEQQDDNKSYIELVEQWVSETDQTDKLSDVRLLKDKLLQRKTLLKTHRNTKYKVSEVDGYNMSSTTKSTILALEEDIYDLKKKIRLPQEYFAEMAPLEGKSEFTEDFTKMATEAGFGDRLSEYAMQHMTKKNLNETRLFKFQLEEYLEGNAISIEEKFLKFINDLGNRGIITDEMSVQEKQDTIILEYSKSRVAPYFKKFTTDIVAETLSQLESGELSFEDFAANGTEFLKFNADFAWQKSNEFSNKVNLFYKQEFYKQPSNDYLNDKWFNHFGISKESYLNSKTGHLDELTPTKNKDEFELLKTLVNVKETSLENYSEEGNYDPYKMVQVSRTAVEKQYSLLGKPKSTIKEIWKDAFENRLDDQDYGAQTQDSVELGIKTIPKYYLHDLEDNDTISESIVSSAFMILAESEKYKQKKAAESSVKAMERHAANQRFVEGRAINGSQKIVKKGETSHLYGKTAELVDYQLYGIKQNRKMTANILGKERDITQAINSFKNVVRFTNLGFSPIIDLTSGTTGILNNVVTRLSGEYYSNSAAKRADKVGVTLVSDYMLESSKFNKQSKLYKLEQLFDFNNALMDNIEDSKFSRMQRFLGFHHLAFSGSKAANFPVGGRLILLQLMDTRYVDGQFMTFTDYKAYRRQSEDATNIQNLKIDWDKAKSESLYDHLDFTGDSITFNSKFTDKGLTEENFNDLVNDAVSVAKQIAQNEDGVLSDLDSPAAQRDVLLSTTLMHSGWLILALTKRFRKEGFNPTTGRMETGHYTAMYDYMKDLYTNYRAKLKGEEYKTAKELKQSLSEHRKSSIRRFKIEAVALALLMMLGKAMLDYTDDDDDSYAEDLVQLVYTRTVSEFSTSFVTGIPVAIVEKAEQPIVPLRAFKALTIDLAYHVVEGDGGKIYKDLEQGTLLKRYKQLSDLDKALDNYRYFNDRTLWLMGTAK